MRLGQFSRLLAEEWLLVNFNCLIAPKSCHDRTFTVASEEECQFHPAYAWGPIRPSGLGFENYGSACFIIQPFNSAIIKVALWSLHGGGGLRTTYLRSLTWRSLLCYWWELNLELCDAQACPPELSEDFREWSVKQYVQEYHRWGGAHSVTSRNYPPAFCFPFVYGVRNRLMRSPSEE